MKPKQKRQIEETLLKINLIMRHIRNVQDNCLLLGTKLIESGKIELGKQLIMNGLIHDTSKLSGIEFEFMAPNIPTEQEMTKMKLKFAIHQHQKTNPHHAEFWAGGIKDMPDVYLAEMACDWKSRSEEFGTDLRVWINEVGSKKYKITKDDEAYKKIMDFVDLLCAAPFQDLSKS